MPRPSRTSAAASPRMAGATPSSNGAITATRRHPERRRHSAWGDGAAAKGIEMQESRTTRAAEIAYIALILALAAIVWREANRLPAAPYDPLGPKAFPIWVSYALAG